MVTSDHANEGEMEKQDEGHSLCLLLSQRDDVT